MPTTLTIPDRLRDVGPYIGKPISRPDGPNKVTGRAKYAAEYDAEGLTHGYVVLSAIAKGRIARLDASAALKLPGVLAVFSHLNRPNLAWFDHKWKDEDAPDGSPFRPLYDEHIHFSMQPVALVVAETFEAARAGARLVEIDYEAVASDTNLRASQDRAREPRKGKGGFTPPPKPRGDFESAFNAAAVKIEAEYYHGVEHHNPMEMHASTVIVEDDGGLTIYDKTQGCQNSQKYVCNIFNLPTSSVRVKNPFVGGGFGSGLRPQYQLFLAVLAATQLNRSVRVELTRPQMFSFGHRPETIQRLKLACDEAGKLAAVMHQAIGETSQFEDYVEVVVNWSGMNYDCDNVKAEYKVVPLDVYTPLDMRAPGAATGVFALECAMDELAVAAGVDPVELRIRNFAAIDKNTGQPFSSKELLACYKQGAERIGWQKRNPQPRSMRDGHHLIGYGMAGGAWESQQGQAAAKATLSVDGKLVVASGTADIGTGTYTAMTIVAADTLGVPVEDVTFKLGDSSLPFSPLEGGSWTVASVGPAVKAACEAIGERLFKLAQKMEGSAFAKAGIGEIEFRNGGIQLKGNPTTNMPVAVVMRSGNVLSIAEEARAIPNYLKQRGFTRNTHHAVFAEVRVDEDLGTIGVSRIISAVAAGRIISAKTARSQVLGALVWGMGMALEEETFHDYKLGRFMNHDLAEYHVPVCADVHEMDAIFVEEVDDVVNPLGAKGIGEIGIVGTAAAIANAVYHATGKRLRDLPLTPDKLLLA